MRDDMPAFMMHGASTPRVVNAATDKAPSFFIIQALNITGWVCIVGSLAAAYLENDDAMAIFFAVGGASSAFLWFGFALLLKMVNQIRWQLMTVQQRESELNANPTAEAELHRAINAMAESSKK